MNFEDFLKQTMKAVEGAEAALLMGLDGIPVAEVKNENLRLPLQEISIECTRFLQDAAKMASANDMGALQEMVLSLDRYRLLFRVVDQNYFLALLLTPEANLGKGRYALRRSLPDLIPEL